MGKELRRFRSLGWYEFYSALPSPTPPLAPSPPRRCSGALPPCYRTPPPTAFSSTSKRPASPHAPACPTILGMIPSEEARAQVELWSQDALDDLTSIRDQLAAGGRPADIHRRRRQAIAIGQTETAEWARDRVCGTVGISAASSATSTPRRTPASTSATSKAGSVIARTSTWPRNSGASARWGGTSSTPAFPSGPCTSMAREQWRASWSRTAPGAPPKATGPAPLPSTRPASRPSPSTRHPISTACLSTACAMSAPSFATGSALAVFLLPHLLRPRPPPGSPSGQRSASHSRPSSCATPPSSTAPAT